MEQLITPPLRFQDFIQPGPILTAVENLGFAAPTPVQAATIPAALAGKDLIVQAQTGSGKTFAFVVPMLIRLGQTTVSGEFQKGTFGLIVSPTRELATQINDVIRSISKDIEPACLIGGASVNAQISSLRKDPRIVVGTPGRILDLIRQRELLLRKCQMFVLDEADEMLSMGFLEDVRAILAKLPKRSQGLFVSATITPRVNMLAGSFLTKPETISVARHGGDLPPIDHSYYEVGPGVTDKAGALCDIIEIMQPRSALIFCNTKSDTETVEIFLRRRGFDARRINSDLSQNERTYIMSKIKAQELRFLVGTDIAARGIDIEQMDLVINYALPPEPESYVHRTGRTGRAGRSGTALSLVGPQDFMPFTMLKKHLTFELNLLPLPTEEEVVQARLAHVYQIVRETELELSVRDMAVARKLVHEVGNIENPSEDLIELVAKLSRFMVEHFVKLETATLEDEIKVKPQHTNNRPSHNEHQGQKRSDHRGGGRDRGGQRSRGSRR